jgi:ABC-2 type transport system permease protein
MNLRAIAAIYRFEMGGPSARCCRSVVSPVLSTSLYFVVFGAAIGSRIEEVEGVSYGAFIVPGLIMLTVLTAGVSATRPSASTSRNSSARSTSFCRPRVLPRGHRGLCRAAATKALMIGLIILGDVVLLRRPDIAHPSGWWPSWC